MTSQLNRTSAQVIVIASRGLFHVARFSRSGEMHKAFPSRSTPRFGSSLERRRGVIAVGRDNALAKKSGS